MTNKPQQIDTSPERAQMTDIEAAEILTLIAEVGIACADPAKETEALEHAAKRLRDMQWKDISTAPKDGAWILIWNRHDESSEVWSWDKTDWLNPDGLRWGTSDPHCDPDYMPTHWMPLPPSPTTFSDFITNASAEEKTAVYGEVMDRASDEQRGVVE